MGELNELTFHREMVDSQLEGEGRMWPHVWGLVPCKKGIGPKWKAVSSGANNQRLLIGRRGVEGCATVERTETSFLHVRIFCETPYNISRSIRNNLYGNRSFTLLKVRDEPGYGYHICRHIEENINTKYTQDGEWEISTSVEFVDSTTDQMIPQYARLADPGFASLITDEGPQATKKLVGI